MSSNIHRNSRREHGLTLVEMMVALAIGSFLMIGAVQIYNQSRQAFVINESIARVQETAQFAMDTIEADLRMASNWGMTSRPMTIVGRAEQTDVNPKTLSVPMDCGEDWSLELTVPVDGFNNVHGLTCPPDSGAAQANSDVLTIRRASVNPVPLQAGRLQIQTTRVAGEIFDDGIIPGNYTAADSSTHNLMASSYYVDANSALIPGVPTLRRMSLGVQGANAAVFDQEIAPGVENLQVQFGIDADDDDHVDLYVDSQDSRVTAVNVISVRLWMLMRAEQSERGLGYRNTHTYSAGHSEAPAITPARGSDYSPDYRRLALSKTIRLRNQL